MTSVIEGDTSLIVGAATLPITPEPGCALQGYGLRFAERVDHPLVASALALGSDGIEWLLISLDLIGVDRTFTDRVRTVVASRLPVARDAITLACSHTHSGPP